jgi:HK97 family phage prohead protease
MNKLKQSPMPMANEGQADFIDRCVSANMDEGDTEAEITQECQMMWDMCQSMNMSGTGMGRAYSLLTIKSIDEDQRIIEGVASTPTADRIGDIVNPMGAKFKLPMPMLWQHNTREPIGHVVWAQPKADGIPFKAKIAKSLEPGTLKDRLDEAWQSIKLGLVRAVSIGFSPIKYAMLKDGGMDFQEWDWLELSAVTIPANTEATITTIRAAFGASNGMPGAAGEKINPAGVTAPAKITTKIKGPKTMKKTNADRITDLEATRAANVAAMEAVNKKATDEGRTKDAQEQVEFDDLYAATEGVDRELADFRKLEKLKELLDAQPDATLAEFRDQCGVKASLTSVFRALDRLGARRKKSP